MVPRRTRGAIGLAEIPNQEGRIAVTETQAWFVVVELAVVAVAALRQLIGR